MSAVADALNKLGVENTEAIQTAETLVSGVTSLLSIYSAIGTVATQLISLWEEEDTPLTGIMSDLMNNCISVIGNLLQEEAHKIDQNERIRDIHDKISESRAAASIALSYMAAPNGEYDIGGAHNNSLASLEFLLGRPAFGRHFAPSLVFDMWLYNGIWDLDDKMDPGSKIDFPPPDLDWDYRFALPALLEAIAAHLIVLKAIEPDTYLQSHQEIIHRSSEYLLQIHNKILEGITIIAPPPHEVKKQNYLGQIPENSFYGWWGYKVGTHYVPLRLGEGDPNILLRPYGAVERYSGVYSIGKYPHYELPHDAYLAISLEEFYTKFHVRALNHKIAVYHAVGLPAVWSAIMNLKTLIGDPIPELPENLHGLSMRTVAATMSPHGVYQPADNGSIKATELMHAIGDAPDPIHCRDMLENGVSEGWGPEGP